MSRPTRATAESVMRKSLPLALLLLAANVALGATPNCNAAPYGARIGTFVAYEKDLRQFVPAHVLLRDICRAKFEHKNLATLRKLTGLSNAEIESTSMSKLALMTLNALRRLVRPVRTTPQPIGVYAPFMCLPQVGQCDYMGPEFESRRSCVEYAQTSLTQTGYPIRCMFKADRWQ